MIHTYNTIHAIKQNTHLAALQTHVLRSLQRWLCPQQQRWEHPASAPGRSNPAGASWLSSVTESLKGIYSPFFINTPKQTNWNSSWSGEDNGIWAWTWHYIWTGHVISRSATGWRWLGQWPVQNTRDYWVYLHGITVRTRVFEVICVISDQSVSFISHKITLQIRLKQLVVLLVKHDF